MAHTQIKKVISWRRERKSPRSRPRCLSEVFSSLLGDMRESRSDIVHKKERRRSGWENGRKTMMITEKERKLPLELIARQKGNCSSQQSVKRRRRRQHCAIGEKSSFMASVCVYGATSLYAQRWQL